MAIRTYSGAALYDSASDVSYRDEEIGFVMAILGMDVSTIDTVTIDEIVEAARTMFPFTGMSSEMRVIHTAEGVAVTVDGDIARAFHSSAEDYLNAHKDALRGVVRRHWHWRHYAKEAS